MFPSRTILVVETRGRSVRIARGATQLALTACVVTSCAFPETLFRIGGAPAIQDAAGPVHRLNSPHPAAARPDTGDLEREMSIAVTPGEQTPASALEGVGSKPMRPLADVRKQLARLLKSGSMERVSDEHINEGSSTRGERYFVQIGSHQLRSAAESHWGGARIGLSAFIGSFDLRIHPADLPGQGMFFRVQIGPIRSEGAALDLCRALKTQQQTCFTLAEKDAAPAETAANVPLNGGWASIGPSDDGRSHYAAARDSERRAAIDARQVAHAAPLYTVPRLAALPD